MKVIRQRNDNNEEGIRKNYKKLGCTSCNDLQYKQLELPLSYPSNFIMNAPSTIIFDKFVII